MEDNRELLKLQGNLAIPSPLISKTNRLVLMFSSDNNVIKQGFQATFRGRSIPNPSFLPQSSYFGENNENMCFSSGVDHLFLLLLRHYFVLMVFGRSRFSFELTFIIP